MAPFGGRRIPLSANEPGKNSLPFAECKLATSPRERNPCSTMPIVVNNQPTINLLCFDPYIPFAVRSQPNHRFHDISLGQIWKNAFIPVHNRLGHAELYTRIKILYFCSPHDLSPCFTLGKALT